MNRAIKDDTAKVSILTLALLLNKIIFNTNEFWFFYYLTYLINSEQSVHSNSNGHSNSLSKIFNIYYDVSYGNQDKEWCEVTSNKNYVSEEPFLFDYDVSQKEQQLTVKIAIDIKDSLNSNTEDFKSNGVITKPLMYWFKAKFDILDTLMLKGEYQTPK